MLHRVQNRGMEFLRTTTVARHWLTVEHSKWTGEAGQVFPPPPIPLSNIYPPKFEKSSVIFRNQPLALFATGTR
jgi:hypothetical protein